MPNGRSPPSAAFYVVKLLEFRRENLFEHNG